MECRGQLALILSCGHGQYGLSLGSALLLLTSIGHQWASVDHMWSAVHVWPCVSGRQLQPPVLFRLGQLHNIGQPALASQLQRCGLWMQVFSTPSETRKGARVRWDRGVSACTEEKLVVSVRGSVVCIDSTTHHHHHHHHHCRCCRRHPRTTVQTLSARGP
jgi:hypothetical protein